MDVCAAFNRSLVLALALALVLSGQSTARAAEPAPASIVAGHIVNVAGQVRIRKDGSKDTKDVRLARGGDLVMVGDIINTPSDGRIKLLLKDRSIMDLGPSSLFKVNAFKAGAGPAGNDRQVETTMAYGSLRAAVTQKLEGKGHFKVRSPSATMGVRGTEFITETTADLKTMAGFMSGNGRATANRETAAGTSTRVTVVQGAVGMESAGARASGTAPGREMILQAGQAMTFDASTAAGRAPGQPETVNPQSMANMRAAAVTPENTFAKSVEVTGASRAEEKQQEREKAREEKVTRSESKADAESGKTEKDEGSREEAQSGPAEGSVPETASSEGSNPEAGSGEASSGSASSTAQADGGPAGSGGSSSEGSGAEARAPASQPAAAPAPALASFMANAASMVNTSLATPVAQSITTAVVGMQGVLPPTAINQTQNLPVQLQISIVIGP
jgi:hypothetical protein